MSSKETSETAMRDCDRARQEIMSVLAHAEPHDLEALWADWKPQPSYELLRGPETGLVMVRGRIGGGGKAFNFGEATVTRATVRLDTGHVGHAYSLGSDVEKVRIAAIIDGLWQLPELQADLERRILQPLREKRLATDIKRAQEVAATKVNFFTMVRGDD